MRRAALKPPALARRSRVRASSAISSSRARRRRRCRCISIASASSGASLRRGVAGLDAVAGAGPRRFARADAGGRGDVPWSTMAAILVIARLCEPSSELHIAEDWYRSTALEDLLGRAGGAGERRSVVPRARPALAAQGGAREAPQDAAGRAVRPRLRPAALRRHEHVFRGAGQGQAPGQAGPQPRSPPGLQTGLHRAGRHARGDAPRLRGLRGQPGGRDDGRRRSSRRWKRATARRIASG